MSIETRTYETLSQSQISPQVVSDSAQITIITRIASSTTEKWGSRAQAPQPCYENHGLT